MMEEEKKGRWEGERKGAAIGELSQLEISWLWARMGVKLLKELNYFISFGSV